MWLWSLICNNHVGHICCFVACTVVWSAELGVLRFWRHSCYVVERFLVQVLRPQCCAWLCVLVRRGVSTWRQADNITLRRVSVVSINNYKFIKCHLHGTKVQCSNSLLYRSFCERACTAKVNSSNLIFYNFIFAKLLKIIEKLFDNDKRVLLRNVASVRRLTKAWNGAAESAHHQTMFPFEAHWVCLLELAIMITAK